MRMPSRATWSAEALMGMLCPCSGASFTRVGFTRRPPLATAATARAAAKGVTWTAYCPMEVLYVSPRRHGSPKVSSFHAGVGEKPLASPESSMPVGVVRPKASYQ